MADDSSRLIFLSFLLWSVLIMMWNLTDDDDDVVATEVFKAHLAHKKNKNGMFHFGTHQLG